MSRVGHIPDVTPRFVSRDTTTRQEYCAYISKLENERSIWESRIRVCEEREYMYKAMLTDLCTFLLQIFQATHEHFVEANAKAHEMSDAVRNCMARLEL